MVCAMDEYKCQKITPLDHLASFPIYSVHYTQKELIWKDFPRYKLYSYCSYVSVLRASSYASQR